MLLTFAVFGVIFYIFCAGIVIHGIFSDISLWLRKFMMDESLNIEKKDPIDFESYL